MASETNCRRMQANHDLHKHYDVDIVLCIPYSLEENQNSSSSLVKAFSLPMITVEWLAGVMIRSSAWGTFNFMLKLHSKGTSWSLLPCRIFNGVPSLLMTFRYSSIELAAPHTTLCIVCQAEWWVCFVKSIIVKWTSLLVTSFIIHSHIKWFLQKRKQTVLPKCSYHDITEDPNRIGGQIFLSANLLRAVSLAFARVVEGKYGGATSVNDFTIWGYFAAKAVAIIQPMEWETKWNDFSWKGFRTDISIISIWSSIVYNPSVGFGLLPKPSRSTANILWPSLALSERFGNTVSAQKVEEERNPCTKIMLSMELLTQSLLPGESTAGSFRTKWSLSLLFSFLCHDMHEWQPQSDHREGLNAPLSSPQPPSLPPLRPAQTISSLNKFLLPYNVSESLFLCRLPPFPLLWQ